MRVRVKSFFVAAQSSEAASLFTFAYRITITNARAGGGAVQLLNRHWTIEDGDGRVEEVRGPGVVGEQPVLAPGASYSYNSFAQLRTPGGQMRGEYEFVELGGDGAAGARFDVEIGTFGLDSEDDVPPGGK